MNENPFYIVKDKPTDAGPIVEPNAPIRNDSNIGRFVDGRYEFDEMRPTSVVLVGSKKTNKVLTCVAMWDTGSTRTCISPEIAQELELQPVKTKAKRKYYNASLRIAVDLAFDEIEVPECKLPTTIGVLIGMDIISKGELCLIPDPENDCGYFRFIMP